MSAKPVIARKPKALPYLILTDNSASDLEERINKLSDVYEAVSIADTNSYLTVLLKLKGK